MKHVDGSPVTMYDWGMPSAYLPDKISWIGDRINITYTFPHFSYSRKEKTSCRGLLFVEPVEPVFLDIPCDLPVPGAVFLCERHNTSSLSSLGTHMVTTVCPHGWVAVHGDCYRIYQLNLTPKLPESGLCQRGEVVNYGPKKQIAHKGPSRHNVDVYRELNQILIYLMLWLEDKNGRVLLINNAIETPSLWEKYIVVDLPRFTENTAVSALSTLRGVRRYVTSFEGIAILATPHVFCKTSQDHVRNSCQSNQFTCDNGTCILNIYQCDGIFHCVDGTDEIECQQICNAKKGTDIKYNDTFCTELCQAPSCVCDGMFFQCQKGGCVSWSHVCDCQRHCHDGSDEQSCLLCHHGTALYYTPGNRIDNLINAIQHKEQGTFVCGDKRMIPLDWVGDMVSDCHGNSDDELMYHMFLSTRKSNFTGCPSGQTTCIDGFDKCCFPVEATCAYEADKHGKTKYCPNGAHFLSCSMIDCQSRYKCPHSYCIEIHMVCDGKFDCPNGEDEGLFCGRPSCPGMLRCSESSVCVHARYIEDGIPHCLVSADDERVYPSACEPLCKCYGRVKDCSFGRGEINETTTLLETWTVIVLQYSTLKFVPLEYLPNTLIVLDLSFNQITQLLHGEFKHLYNLHELRLQGNLIESTQSLTFFGLSSLQTLALTSNRISILSTNSFLGLYNLIILHLDNNVIKHIMSCAFEGLNKINKLILKRNRLTKIDSTMLCGLDNVQYLDLSFNSLKAIHLPPSILDVIIHVHQVKYCCLLPRRTECVPLIVVETVSYTCPKVLKSKEIVIWVLFLAVFLPNSAAPFCWRKTKSQHESMTFLVSLLHAVDALTALPILVVAIVDTWYDTSYKRHAVEWSESIICKGVAYIGYVTFILSIGCITLITRQRYLGVAYPLHKQDISRRFAVTYFFTIFIISSACILITFLMDSQIKTVQLNPLCLIYAQSSNGLKSNWFSCLYVFMNVSIIPVIYYSLGTVYSLTKQDIVLERKGKITKPTFKIVFTLLVYVLICVSLSIMEITNVWHPLTDVGRLVMFISIFPLHALTNPWMVTLIPCLQSAMDGFRKNKKKGHQPIVRSHYNVD